MLCRQHAARLTLTQPEISLDLGNIRRITKWESLGVCVCQRNYLIFDKYGVDNCRMILVEEYEVIDRRAEDT